MRLAKIISYFFHPLNFSIIGALVYFILLPRHLFKPQEYAFLGVIAFTTYFLPITLVYFMKKFKLIESYNMKTIEERKFPILLFISISYMIGIWLFKSRMVDLLSLSYFGYGLFLFIAYIFLFFKLKISLHAGAIGGLIGFLMYYSYFYSINIIPLLITLFILSGIIASARLKLKAHSLLEIFLGYSLAIISQIVIFLMFKHYIFTYNI